MAGIRYKGQIFSGAASFGSADDVSYDNTTSGLTATDVQGAVDEVANTMIFHANVDDCNNATETGFYNYTQDMAHSLYTEKSIPGGGNMLVVHGGSFVHQIVFIGNTNIYMRRLLSGTWNDWRKIDFQTI